MCGSKQTSERQSRCSDVSIASVTYMLRPGQMYYCRVPTSLKKDCVDCNKSIFLSTFKYVIGLDIAFLGGRKVRQHYYKFM